MISQRRMMWFLLAIMLLSSVAGFAQTTQAGAAAAPAYQFKVGVLPFVDTTGSLGDKVTAVARLLQSDLAHNSDLEVRFIKPDDESGSDIDSEQAVKMARDHNHDVVVTATILTAEVVEADHSAQGPSVFGQSLGGSTHSAKATVELQADVYSSTTGKKIDSIRVTGEEKVTKLTGSASTTLGEWDGNGAAPDSPLGKAMQKAIHSLSLRISGDETKMVRYQPPSADAAPAETKPSN